MAYPIDNLFRKPVEFIAAAASLTVAAVIGAGSPWIGFSKWATWCMVLFLVLHAVWRARSGWEIVKFQVNLRWLPKYELASDAIPLSRSELFLGMGFWWDQRHTQRLYLARQPQYRHLRARNDLYETARQFVRDHPESRYVPLLNWNSRFNPVAPLPPVGGDPAIHGIEPRERPMWQALGERVGHTIVLGTTRVGKTRLAELLITQDIHRGDVVIVFDPKGDLLLLQRMYAEACRAGRQNEFYFFHLGFPEFSDRYNPIATVGRGTEVATRVANPIPGEGNSAAFKQFVWLYVNLIARAASALGMTPTYALVYQYAADLDSLAEQYFELWLNREHPDWREKKELSDSNIPDKMMQQKIMQTGRSTSVIQFVELVQSQHWNDPIANSLISVLANNKNRYQALINSLFPLLEKLTSGKVSELLSPNLKDMSDRRRVFDWDLIMNTGGIVYFGLDALSDAEVAGAVGNAAFSDLTSTAGRRYKFGTSYGQSQGMDVGKSRKVDIHADEFNELIGDEFVPMVNKAGGAGYQVTAYTQTWSDVEARIGNAAKAQQIGGNFNTLIMLRVKNIETAELLTDQLPMVELYTSLINSGTTDATDPDSFADFSAKTEDKLSAREVPMLQPTDLVQLPKGQAFALLDGGQLAKLRLPLSVEADDDVHWPANMQACFSGMHSQYQKYIASLGAEGEDELNPLEQLPADFAGNIGNNLTVEGKGGGW